MENSSFEFDSKIINKTRCSDQKNILSKGSALGFNSTDWDKCEKGLKTKTKNKNCDGLSQSFNEDDMAIPIIRLYGLRNRCVKFKKQFCPSIMSMSHFAL